MIACSQPAYLFLCDTFEKKIREKMRDRMTDQTNAQ